MAQATPRNKSGKETYKKGEYKRPGKHLMLFTGIEKPTKKQIAAVLEVLDWAIEHGCFIVTTDHDGTDVEVIKYLNSKKYKRMLVWGADGVCRYSCNYGQNHAAGYMAYLRDDIVVARTGAMIAVGTDARLEKMLTFATNLRHKVVQR